MTAAAKIARVSKVDSTGTVTRLDKVGHAGEVVTPQDVEDKKKLSELLTNALQTQANHESRAYPRRIDFEGQALGNSGATVSLRHAFNAKVRWSVVNWTSGTLVPDDAMNYRSMWVERGLKGPALATSNNPAGNFTTGCRFQVSTAFKCPGIRFFYFNGGASRTYRAKLWRDSTGEVLGSADVVLTANSSGLAVAYFATQVDLASHLNADLTASIWDTAGGVYIRTDIDRWHTISPMYIPGVVSTTLVLYAAGDARPTNTSAVDNFWVEPILTPKAHPYDLVEDSTSDANTLVLQSYAGGTATIRVEASE